jgi:hypothetical protein
MPIKLNGATSGYTQLQAAATAASNTLTLPAGGGSLVAQSTTTAPTNGQIPIGNGTDYTPATITAGTGITVTNAAGSITLAASGAGFSNMSIGTYTAATNSSGSSLVWNSNGSLTWTVPTGVTSCYVKVMGGGGAGGGGNNVLAMGYGGGGGGASERYVTGLTPGSTVTVTVGGGGAGVSGASGNSGGSSSFGAYCSATGGTGGSRFAIGTLPAPASAANGTGTGGSLNLTGKYAQVLGPFYSYASGCGGSISQQCYGQAGGFGAYIDLGTPGLYNTTFSANVAGSAASGYGAGGGGAQFFSVNQTGGAGASGVVIIQF